MTIHKIVNLPDLLFMQYCKEAYGVNRGVLNTIDSWLYHNNINSIIARRESMIEFLQYFASSLKNSPSEKNNRLKIGKGNLTYLLEKYFDNMSYEASGKAQ